MDRGNKITDEFAKRGSVPNLVALEQFRRIPKMLTGKYIKDRIHKDHWKYWELFPNKSMTTNISADHTTKKI